MAGEPQARGLEFEPEARRALASHILTYTLAFSPVFILVGDDIGANVVPVIALVALPHWVQDDGRLLTLYIRKLKGAEAACDRGVAAAADQTFHFVVLLLTAFVAGS